MWYKFADADNEHFKESLAHTAYIADSGVDLSQPAHDDEDDENDPNDPDNS